MRVLVGPIALGCLARVSEPEPWTPDSGTPPRGRLGDASLIQREVVLHQNMAAGAAQNREEAEMSKVKASELAGTLDFSNSGRTVTFTVPWGGGGSGDGTAADVAPNSPSEFDPRDAIALMLYIIKRVNEQALHRVIISAEEMHSIALHGDIEHGTYAGDMTAYVHRLLNALRMVEFVCVGKEGDVGCGSLIGEWHYFPEEVCPDAEGLYYIDVQMGFLGCPVPTPVGADAHAPVGPGDGSDQVATEDAYVSIDNGMVMLCASAGLTASQRRLCEYMGRNIALESDAGADPADAASATSGPQSTARHRLYDRTYCDLLPGGLEFVGVLGNFRRRPAGGMKLLRANGSRRVRESLVTALGHEPTSAGVNATLDDLRTIVEEHLDGVVACQYDGYWLPLSTARALFADEMPHEMGVSMFLPSNYTARRFHRWAETTGCNALLEGGGDLGEWGTPSERDPLLSRLEKAISTSGLKKQQVARRLGVSPSMLSKLVNRKKSIPSARRTRLEEWVVSVENKNRTRRRG